MVPLLLIFASFLPLSPPSQAACSPKTCGKLTVAYPFWLEDNGQPPCGSPSFPLNGNGGQAFLAHSFLGRCLPRWFNISSGLGLGSHTMSNKNRELLVLYNCTEQQLQAPPPGFLRMP
ncbi:hypothetical protein ZWY2020_031677 [Hordeum vulgare]|nr:hypothetical protein ZWY2020_031677 [Hordeum vulgare]